MEINNLLTCTTGMAYYDAMFRSVLEDHLIYLRQDETTRPMAVSPETAYHYEGNFYGLLSELRVPSHLHWLVMRMAGYTSPNEVGLELKVIHLPDQQKLEQMRSRHSTTHKFQAFS